MTRSFVTFAAALALLGCRAEERDRNPVIDETGDAENCPGCFDATGMLWNLQAALQDGELTAVNTTAGQRSALLTVMLVEEEFDPSAEDAAEHSCTMTYTPSMQPGSQPGALLDWDLSLEPVENGCPELDPDWVDAELYTTLPTLALEMVGAELDAAMEDYLSGWFETLELDWANDGEPYYFGLSSRVDGQVVYREDDTEAGAEFQGHYGRAFAVDADLAIVDEATGGRLLTRAEIAEGGDAWFEIYARTFFIPYLYLR